MMKTPKTVTAVIIGAGNRGKDVYGQYAQIYPDEIKIIAVAEPNEIRRREFASQHNLQADRIYESWETLLAEPKIADVAIITTQDRLHTQPSLQAMEMGYQVLLEKPMAPNLKECVRLVKKANETGSQLRIAHVLRYTEFFQTLKSLITNGRIGEIMTIDLRENISYYHYAHSFVRGNWNNLKKSSPMILAKSCHDLDLLYWLVGVPAKFISSFGSLLHFHPGNAPVGATPRCLDGCLATTSCKYYAPRIYIDIIPLLRIAIKSTSREVRILANLALHRPRIFHFLKRYIPSFRRIENYDGWPVSVITDDLSISGKWKALETTDYGKCVYFSENDVVDHQVVNLEFENKVTATFTMHGFSHEEGRTIRVDGTTGTIIGEFLDSGPKLTLYDHFEGSETIVLDQSIGVDTQSGHGGGDFRLMRSFIDSIRDNTNGDLLTSAKASLESHILAFASEESRLKKKVVSLEEFKKYAFSEN
ncbi:MAG: Gfo/Idh/MocA family protein [Candidatus Hodarchaeales archaeon]|jgi:predicted dehydrogenase